MKFAMEMFTIGWHAPISFKFVRSKVRSTLSSPNLYFTRATASLSPTQTQHVELCVNKNRLASRSQCTQKEIVLNGVLHCLSILQYVKYAQMAREGEMVAVELVRSCSSPFKNVEHILSMVLSSYRSVEKIKPPCIACSS